MSFTPETGVGVTGANSYLSVAEFVSYWAIRGTDYSDAEPEVLVAALINATDYVEMRWGQLFRGARLTATQGLAWPRYRAYDREGIELTEVPQRLKNAIAEYAKRAITADLAPDPDFDPNVVQRTESVGPISESFTYSGGPVERWRAYPKADAWLKELCTQPGGSYR